MNDTPRMDSETLAEVLYSHNFFHEGEPNPTANLMREGAERIRQLERELAAKNAATQEPTVVKTSVKPNGPESTPAVAAPDAQMPEVKYTVLAMCPNNKACTNLLVRIDQLNSRIEQLTQELDEVTGRESINYKMSILNKEEAEKQYERAEKAEAALAEAQKHNAVLIDIVKRLGVYLPQALQPEADLAIDAAMTPNAPAKRAAESGSALGAELGDTEDT